MREDDPGRRVLHDPSPVQEDDPVGDVLGKTHVVGHDQHGDVAFLGQHFQHLEHLAHQLGVERRRDLVEEHDPGLHGQRPGDGHPLFLTSRELGRIGIDLVQQADLFQQGQCPLPGRVPGQAQDPHGRHRQVLQHRHVGKQIELLEDHAHLAPNLPQAAGSGGNLPSPAVPFPDRLAVDEHLARVHALQSHEDSEYGRFAGSAGSDQGQLLGGGHLEIEIVQHQEVSIRLPDPAHGDDGIVTGWGQDPPIESGSRTGRRSAG